MFHSLSVHVTEITLSTPGVKNAPCRLVRHAGDRADFHPRLPRYRPRGEVAEKRDDVAAALKALEGLSRDITMTSMSAFTVALAVFLAAWALRLCIAIVASH
jgi:hypothetical protein